MEFDTQCASIGRRPLTLASSLTEYINRLKQLFSSCCLCGQKAERYNHLCRYCYHDLPTINLPTSSPNLLSWPAINRLLAPYKFDELISVSNYIWPYDIWIKQLKYQHQFNYANLLGPLLADHYNRHYGITPDLSSPTVISVPCHIKKWQQRGFNQSHLLAQKFSKHLGLKYDPEMIVRLDEGKPQVGQSGISRRKHKPKFALTNENQTLPKHVVLIDDVVTTGTTANAICRLLKSKGVHKVSLVTLCISLPF